MKVFVLFIIFLFCLGACMNLEDAPSEPFSIANNTINNQRRTNLTIFKKCIVEENLLQIEYSLSTVDSVEILIYNICCKLIETLVDQDSVSTGNHSFTWELDDNLGVIFCKIKIGKEMEIKKIIVKFEK